MAGGFLPPAAVARLQAGAPARNGSYLGNIAHWLAPHGLGPVFGPHALAKAGMQTGGELIHSFDPRSRAGLANIAGLFAGGPEGDATPQMDALGMKGQFATYNHETGTALDRGLINEGPIRPGKGYNPSIQKMVERAHTNPFLRASKGVVSRAQQDAMEKQTALDMVRQNAARAMHARRQIDEHLGSAPMQAHQPFGRDVSAGYLHGPSEIAHPSFLKGLLNRRYQAASRFHHN